MDADNNTVCCINTMSNNNIKGEEKKTKTTFMPVFNCHVIAARLATVWMVGTTRVVLLHWAIAGSTYCERERERERERENMLRQVYIHLQYNIQWSHVNNKLATQSKLAYTSISC